MPSNMCGEDLYSCSVVPVVKLNVYQVLFFVYFGLVLMYR